MILVVEEILLLSAVMGVVDLDTGGITPIIHALSVILVAPQINIGILHISGNVM